MADYENTVSVELYDDFEKLQQALDRLLPKLERIKSKMMEISKINFNSNNLTRMVNQIDKLSNLNGLDKKVDSINKALSNLNFSNIKKINDEISRMKKEYAEFIATMNLKAGNNLKKSNISTYVKNKDYDSSDVNDLRGTRNQNITSYINHMNNGLSSVDRTAQKTRKSISSMFSLGKVYWFMNYTKQAFRGLGNIIQSALDFTEVENYFSRAMGNMYDKAMSFQNKLTDMYGMAQATMMQAQATYKNMIGSLGGLSDEMSYNLSETVTKMTLDFSSLYNVDFDKTVQKFQSALSKQVRPIRSVSGYDITQSVLGATASNLGIDRSISQMNELEKRLLVILTLMQQMRNSGAMNDFARTVEQPANQLRILLEQLKEVGRWIGSVFYGVIGKVLPYVNGFVMAIKELVKTFALFVGFEIPNSSGQTGTILDSYGDSMNDLNSGISDTNSGLDGAKKKAKELKGSLAGIDKLNIINKPKDDSSSGKGNGSGGGMSIDPKILDALNGYKYLFDDIHMKAQDIRDELLKWADIAKKSLTENIFRPIKNSWDKYGSSIYGNFKNSFESMKNIASGIFNVVGEKWKPFFQSASDLFFSLLDTASLVSSSISGFLENVWNSGGKYFLEGVFDLATAFMKLATSINDNFVKPTVRLFKNTLGTALSTVLGLVLGLIGKFMTTLSKFVTWISKSEGAVKLLGATMTTVFAVSMIGKVNNLWNSFANGTGTISKIVTLFVENTKVGDKLFASYVNGGVKFGKLKKAWQDGLGVISSFMTKIRNKVDMMIFDKTATEGTTIATKTLTAAQTICAGATTALQTALTFLGNHPLVALVIGIGTVVTALAVLDSQSGDTTKKIEDCSQEIQDQAQEIKDYSDAVDSAIKSADDQVQSTEAQINMAEKYIEKLKGMADENGFVDNIDQAKFLIDEINKVLPDTFEITKDGQIVQKKTNDELQKNINLTRDQAKARAYQEAYVETLKNELLTEQKLNEQKTEYSRLMEEAETQYQEYLKTADSYNSSQKLTFDQWIKGNEALQEQKALIETTTSELDKQSGSVEYLEDKMVDLTDTMGETLKTNGKLSESTKKAFDNIGKSGKNNVNDVIKSLSAYGKKLKQSSEDTSKYTQEEVKTIRKSRDDKVIEYGKMVRDYDLTYDQIIELAKTSGVEFTLAEQGTLASIVEIYRKEGKNAGDDYVNNLSAKISNGSWKISDSAKGNVLDTNEILKNVPIEYRSAVESAIAKAQKARDDAQRNVGGITVGVNTSINWDNVNSNLKKLQQKFVNNLSYNMVLSEKGRKQEESVALLKMRPYAIGGFPDVGEIFIARERGPELVGSMGAKTTVANNNQIIEGIQSGVYTAMRQVARESGGSKGDIYIKHQTVLDGKVIDERIEKVNEDHILKTGKPLFIK